MHPLEPMCIIDRCEQNLFSYSYGMKINTLTDPFRIIFKKMKFLINISCLIIYIHRTIFRWK